MQKKNCFINLQCFCTISIGKSSYKNLKKYDYCKEVEVEKLIPNNVDETKNFQRHINKI